MNTGLKDAKAEAVRVVRMAHYIYRKTSLWLLKSDLDEIRFDKQESI